jgi:hypothetical protein
MFMSRRLHIMLTDDQYAFLTRASERTSLSIGELIRRAIDEKYPVTRESRLGREFTLALWRRPTRPERGRRSGFPLD